MTTQTDVAADSAGLSPDQLVAMYRHMVCTREVDARVRTLYLQGKVTGGVYSQLGHEAISVGTAFALRPTDTIAPMHRDLGAHLVRGMDVGRIIAQIMARAAGYTGGKDNALHIGDSERLVLPQISMLGTSIPVAVGAALAAKQRGEDHVALTYVGDGAINTGDFHEGLNFAAALHLAFILIVENNQYAYTTPIAKQIAFQEIAQRAVGYGIPGYRIDGNNVIEVYRHTLQAIHRARAGDGPTLIECVTMRMRGHSENDDASYVPSELLAEWEAKDPLERFESSLIDGGIIGSSDASEIKSEISRDFAAAAEWADAQPLPEPETTFEGVYSSVPFRGRSR
ncbi:MAG: thiamine pyrophosphate-dependent dehydrogenase E1 component subunit alpha [Chloroflexota bacterium]